MIKINKLIVICFSVFMLLSCKQEDKTKTKQKVKDKEISMLQDEVKKETLRSWNAYKKYAWGHDVLLPLSKSHKDWYEGSLGISPIDAYSTLKVMGLEKEAKEIEDYALAMDWDKDLYVQTFEVNIRILGGLLSMYHYTKNEAILAKTKDFGDRILPAFNTPTGIPAHSVNLTILTARGGRAGKRTGAASTETVRVASASCGRPLRDKTGPRFVSWV